MKDTENLDTEIKNLLTQGTKTAVAASLAYVVIPTAKTLLPVPDQLSSPIEKKSVEIFEKEFKEFKKTLENSNLPSIEEMKKAWGEMQKTFEELSKKGKESLKAIYASMVKICSFVKDMIEGKTSTKDTMSLVKQEFKEMTEKVTRIVKDEPTLDDRIQSTLENATNKLEKMGKILEKGMSQVKDQAKSHVERLQQQSKQNLGMSR